MLNPSTSIDQSFLDNNETSSNLLALNDIFLSHFNDDFKDDLSVLTTPLDIEPEFTAIELTKDEMNTYKDFCGSQEWQFQLKKSPSHDHLSSKNVNSITNKASNNCNNNETSSSSSTSSTIHSNKPLESQSFLSKSLELFLSVLSSFKILTLDS